MKELLEKIELIEKLADIEHQRWSDWHKYCRKNWTPENIARWDKQAETPYAELSEQEKASDRREVMRYWPLFTATILAVLTELDRDIADMRHEEGQSKNGIREEYKKIYNQAIAHVRARLAKAIEELGE